MIIIKVIKALEVLTKKTQTIKVLLHLLTDYKSFKAYSLLKEPISIKFPSGSAI